MIIAHSARPLAIDTFIFKTVYPERGHDKLNHFKWSAL